MTNNLKTITDKTFATLLKEEIVLPSNYFETFNQNAVSLEIDTKENIEFEIDTFLTNEVEKIKTISNETISKMETFVQITNEATDALKEQNGAKITSLNSQIITLQHDLESLMEQVYLDDLTKTYNKKWLYNKFLDEDGKINSIHKFVYCKIDDIPYITKEYNEIIANNIIKFIINTIKKKIKYSENSYHLVRFSNDTFLFIFEENMKEIEANIKELQSAISNSTLKTKSGILIKTGFSFCEEKNMKNQPFLELLEHLYSVIEEKELLS